MAQAREKVVLFLCTGNYYRSRLAECLFNSVAGRMRLPWGATSRGLALERGVNNVGPMAASAVQELHALGVRGEPLTRFPVAVLVEDFEQAHWIVALKEAEHRPLLDERFPAWTDRVEYWHVEDAAGVSNEIEREVMDLIARLLAGGRKRAAGRLLPTPGKPKDKPLVRVGRETKGRRGKGVTTVFDLPLDDDGVRELAARLKQRCGTGGTVKDGIIEIQGDQRERLVAELEGMGFRVKRVGG
jgi:predicted translation initiation factor SUI1